MRIELDREKKLVLLQALKDGYIDSNTIMDWADSRLSNMTDDEIEKELERLRVCTGFYEHCNEKEHCPIRRKETTP